jgi:zinc transport system permease protein
MIEFLRALSDPDMLFLRYSLAAGVLASVALGIIGTYVVVRRISYIAGAISHCVLGGVGLGLFLERVWGWTWFHPMYGAIIAALVSAIAIGLVSLYAHQREDTVIGALWSVGMAVGLLFFANTPGYTDPMSYLFGNILLISARDLWIVVLLDVLVVALCVMFHNKMLAVCFDEEFTELRGVNVKLHYLLLLCLTALTVVLLIRVVGIVMVIALITLPAAAAWRFSRRIWQMMVLAAVFCAAIVIAGLWLSYALDQQSGPVIIIIAGAAYLAVALTGRFAHRSN